MPRPAGKYRAYVALVPERAAPFLLTLDDGAWVLVAPFPPRRSGLAPVEAALVRGVVDHLRRMPPPGGSVWIDPATGTATPASIGEPQTRRRLSDCATFNLCME